MQQQKVFKLNMRQVYEEQLKKLDTEWSELKKQERLAENPWTVDEVLEKLKEHRQFRRSVRISPSDQAVYVKVKHVEEQLKERQIVHFVIPDDHEEEAEAYKEHLQKVYGEIGIPEIPFDDLQKFREHMILAKIMGMWCRSRILSFVPEMRIIGVEDIDSGAKAILTMPPHVFKMPKKEEMTKQAFASKVIIENALDEEISPGRFMKIRMTHVDPFGVNFAEAEDEEVIEVEDSQDIELTRDVGEALPMNPREKLIEPAAVAAVKSRPASPPVDVRSQTLDQSSRTLNWEDDDSPTVEHHNVSGAHARHGHKQHITQVYSQDLEVTRDVGEPPSSGPPKKLIESAAVIPVKARPVRPPVDLRSQTLNQSTESLNWDDDLPAVERHNVSFGAPARQHGHKRNKRHITQVKFSQIFKMSYIEMKGLSYGLKVNLYCLSCNEIKQGRLEVSSVPIKNWTFANNYNFTQMVNDIAEYVEKMPKEQYKPR